VCGNAEDGRLRSGVIYQAGSRSVIYKLQGRVKVSYIQTIR